MTTLVLMIFGVILIVYGSGSPRNTKIRVTPEKPSDSSWNGQYVARASNGDGYESYCNDKMSHNCDPKAYLHCQRNKCTCVHTDEMIFDAVKGQCVVKAGGKCIYGRDEPNPELRLKNIDCVLNGYCNREDGRCHCSPRHYNALNVSCVHQKTFDQACHFDIECREDYHLRCIAGFCNCDPSVSVKHRKYEICLGVAGEKAIDGNCIEFSEPISFSPLVATRCQCNEGYVRGRDKKCHGALNQACTVESPCKVGLTCVQGTCKCPFHIYQIYDTIKELCLSEVYGPCNSSSECVSTATCFKSGMYNQCECKPGYIVGSSRRCEKSVGTKCYITPILPSAATASPALKVMDECSSSALLQCRDGRCSCSELKTFSAKQGKCVGIAGSICFKDDEPPVCTENAQCVFKQRLGFGLCLCDSNSVLTVDRKCELIPQLETTTRAPKVIVIDNCNKGNGSATQRLESNSEDNI